MKNKAMLCLGMALAMIFCALSAGASSIKWAAAGENEDLKLYLDTSNVILAVQDQKSGMRWFTSPQDRSSDTIAQGAIPNDLASMLLVSYVDEDNVASTVSARAGSISQKTVTLKKMKNGQGLVIEFHFSRKTEGFTIPLRMTVEGNALRVEIQYDAIVEEGPARITEISLLPYMGAGNASEEGFALIPDGSGALISFDSMKTWAQPYRARVYGKDSALNPVYEGAGLEQVYLPAFGLSREGGTVLGVIAQGDENAWIEAVCPGVTSSYAACWPTFIYRQTDVTVLADNKWNEKQINVTSSRVESENPVVYYYFSSQEGLGEMARLMRSYLTDSLGAVPCAAENPSLVLEVFGATQKEQSVAGVVMESRVSATNFAQAASMLDRLAEAGVEGVEMQLFGFLDGGMYYAAPDESRWDAMTGGEEGWQQLLDTAEARQSSLYVAADMQNQYQTDILTVMNWAPYRIDNSTAWQYAFSLSTGNKNEEEKWISIRPSRLQEVARKVQAGLDAQAGLLALGYGDSLYGDYGSSAYMTRKESKTLSSEILTDLAAQRPLNVMGANLYAALAAGRVSEMPLRSSGYDLTDADVPFYAMVMREFVSLSCVPLNALGDDALLDCMLAGVTPAFRVTGDSPAVYAESRLNFLYNSAFDARVEDLLTAWQAFEQVSEAVAGREAIAYRAEGTVRIMTYEGDVHVAVNAGDVDAVADEQTIPAGGWLIY